MSRGGRVFAVLAVMAAGACGGGGSGPGGGADVDGFVWTEGGKTATATTYAYSLGSTGDGSAFTISIRGISPIGSTCLLTGQFADAVPPPAGHYAIGVLLDGTTEVPQTDRSFTGSCQPSAIVPNGFVLDPSVSGEVVVTASTADRVAGTFTMTASTQPPANASPTTAFTGKFKVGCTPNAGAPCGPLSATGPGTCADLAACCAAADDSIRQGCVSALDATAPLGGDVACARKLAAIKSLYCP